MLRNAGRMGRKWLFVLLIAAGLLMLPQGKVYAATINATMTDGHVLTWTYSGTESLWLTTEGTGKFDGSVLAEWYMEEDTPGHKINKIDLYEFIRQQEEARPDAGRFPSKFTVYLEESGGAVSQKLTVKYNYVEPDPITASISAEGILTWKDYPGAVRYGVGINGFYSYFDKGTNSAALKKLAEEIYTNENNHDVKNTGTLEIELSAYAEDTSKGPLQTWKGSYAYTIKKAFSLSYIVPEGYHEQVSYTGNAVTFTLKVKTIYGTLLVEGKDYSVSYSDNTGPGTAVLKLTGKGEYAGTIELKYTIMKNSTEETVEDTTEDTSAAAATDLGTGTSFADAVKILAAHKTEADLAGTVFEKLQFRALKTAEKQIVFKWAKVKNAKKYVLYGNLCGKNSSLKKVADISRTKKTVTVKKAGGKALKPGKYYKFLLVACDRNDKVLTASKIVHAATAGGKAANPVKLTTAAKKNRVTLKTGKTFKLKAVTAAASKKQKIRTHRKPCFESSNTKVATVTARGVIKGRKKGACYVYAYAQNGLFKKIRVTVTQ